MVTFIICANGPSFIICALAVVFSILYLSTQLGRAAKLVEKCLSSQATRQPPENTLKSHSTTEEDPQAPQTQPAQDPWNDCQKEYRRPPMKHSISSSVLTFGKRMSITRSKSLNFLWRSSRKSSVDDPSPLQPLLHTDLHSPETPVLANPFSIGTEDKGNPERAEPPVSPTSSSATMVESRSASTDEGRTHVPEEVPTPEPPNVHMEPTQTTTLTSPAATAPAPTVSTTSTTTSSSSESSSAQPHRRARTTPKGPRPRPASMSALGVDGRRRYARPACPENSLPGEIFETRFENPFKPRSRSLNIKREKGSTDDTPKRRSLFAVFSSLRQSLIKHKLSGGSGSGAGSEAPSSPTSDSEAETPSSASSRRTSVSSATGTTLSVGSGSGSTKSKWSFCKRSSVVPRTDPYGPPHFAQVPTSISEGRQAQRRAHRG